MNINQDKAIKGLGNCRFSLESGACFCDKCPYFREKDCRFNMAEDVFNLLIAQNEVLAELRKVGYPHGFEKEKPWIVNYMNSITEVIKKAVKLNNG